MNVGTFIRLVVFSAVIFVPLVTLGQPQGSVPSAARDSAFASRVIERGDTALVPWADIGRIADTGSIGTMIVEKSALRRVQYQQLADALARTTPWNQLSHGGFGQHDAVSVLGGRNVDLSFAVNGRTLVDPWSGQYQLVQAQPASIDRVELLLGSDAVGRAASMTLAEVNLPTITHNTATPFTSLWYHQSGGDLVAVDGTISQNIAEGVNVTLGVRRSGARGVFPSTDFDIWNFRGALRWTLSQQTHALVTYQLASLNTELWGGLTIASLNPTVLDIATTPVYSSLRDETRRHDVTAHFAHMFASDSSSVLHATAYTSVSSLLRLRDSTMSLNPTDTLRGIGMSGHTTGLQLRLDQHLAGMHLHLGGSVDVTHFDGSVYAADITTNAVPQLFAQLQAPLSSWMTLRGSARVLVDRGRLLSAAGVALESRIGPIRVLADLSTTTRNATPGEGGVLEPERHMLGMLRATGSSSVMQWSLIGFTRIVSNPIISVPRRDANDVIVTTIAQQGSQQTVVGLIGTATMRLGPIEVIPTVRLQSSSTDTTLQAGSDVPACMADLSIGYVYDAGFSTVTLGVRSTVVTQHWAPQFVPLTWTYVSPLRQAPLQYDGLNVFLSARVGNATVRASFENILGERWYTTSYAPEISQSIRLSVDWSFID